MKRALLTLALMVTLPLTGCVERRMTIVSDPPGAVVFVNGRQIGATPIDVPSELFVYHGHYDVQLFRDGFETLVVKQPVPPKWFEYPLVDFLSECVWPFHVKDNRLFSYQLAPLRATNGPDLLENANVQRARGQALGHPEHAVPPRVEVAPPAPEPATAPPATAPVQLQPPVTPP